MVEVREATDSDNQALLELQKKCPMGTSIVFLADSSPDYFGRSRPYEDWKVFVGTEDSKIVGSAGYATHNTGIDGQACKAAYEYGFIVDPAYRRKGIATQLQNVIEQDLAQKKVDLLHILVVENNLPSLGLFSRMGFQRIKDIVIMSLMVYKKAQLLEGSVKTMERDDYEKVAALINDAHQGYNFFSPFSQKGLEKRFEKMQGFSLENVYLFDHADDAKACLGYWDYDKIMRMTAMKLNWRLRVAVLPMKLLGKITAMPKIPKPSESIRQYYLFPAVTKDNESLIELIKYLNNKALEERVNYMSVPLDPENPVLQAFSQFRHVRITMHCLAKPLTTKVDLSTMQQRKLYVDVLET